MLSFIYRYRKWLTLSNSEKPRIPSTHTRPLTAPSLSIYKTIRQNTARYSIYNYTDYVQNLHAAWC